MGIFLNNNIINEVYIGETKELKEVQHNLSQFRHNMIDNDYYSRKEIKKDKWYKEFVKSMKSTFGYKTFEFEVRFNSNENAYCYSLANQIRKKKDKYSDYVTASKDGFKFKNKFSCKLVITEGLLTNESYSDREIMAILLHEVGHSFYEALDGNAIDMIEIRETVYLVNSILQEILSFISTIGFITSTLELSNGAKSISNIVKHQAEGLTIAKIIKNFINMGIDILKITLLASGSYIPTVLMNIISKANPIALMNTIFGYKDEKSADSFATMYGYGADLSSALHKLEMSKDKDQLITSKALSIMLFPCTIISIALDEHPDCITRAKNQLDYLEKEYADIDDKETKAEIRGQIDSIKKELDKTENLLNNFKDKDVDKMRYMYCLIISKLYKIDVRQLLSKNDPYIENEKSYEKYKK